MRYPLICYKVSPHLLLCFARETEIRFFYPKASQAYKLTCQQEGRNRLSLQEIMCTINAKGQRKVEWVLQRVLWDANHSKWNSLC